MEIDIYKIKRNNFENLDESSNEELKQIAMFNCKGKPCSKCYMEIRDDFKIKGIYNHAGCNSINARSILENRG